MKGRHLVNDHGQGASQALRIVPVENKRDLERFIRVPWRVFADDPHWIPPLVLERKEHLNPKKNPYFAHADVRFWLALRGDEAVGRISAQVDHISLAKHRDATGYFGFLDGEDSADVFGALLGEAERWLASQGMKRIRGPFSLSINDEAGMLVKGFEFPPSLMMGHAKPYYPHRVEEQSYRKAVDMIAYDFDVAEDGLPERLQAMSNRFTSRPDVTVRPLNTSKFFEEVNIVLDIFNDAWSDNWGFVPLTPDEIRKMAKDLKLIIEPEHVCIIEVGGEPAAFGMTLPNLNEAIADLNGRLFPFGWAKLLYRLKFDKIKSARLPLLGVRKKFQRGWYGAAMSFVIIEWVHRRNARRGRVRGELSWILEDNTAMRKIIESTGCRPYKTYRVYEKALA